MTAPRFARVLVDTGPLVAILDRRDHYHRLCSETLRLIQPPLWTTWPVLTEVAWLLRNHPRGLVRLYGGVKSGFFRIADFAESDLSALAAIEKRFLSLRPQLADLSLVLVAERESWKTVFTLDRRDFSAIQRKTRPRLELLPEVLS